MKFCIQCLQSMRCLKNGAVLYMGYHICYDADIYVCIKCHSKIAVVADSSYEVDEVGLEKLKENMGEWFIEMKKGTV